MTGEKGEGANEKKAEQAVPEQKEVQAQPQEAAADGAAEMKDRLLRLAAEFDNYKKRSANDLKGARDLGKAELMAKLLPSIDEFELALTAMSSSEAAQDHVKGVELVFSNINDILKAEGLKEISADGKYDPYRHEVMLTKPSDKEDGTILEVIRKGYMFNDIMLRPTSVIISKGRPKE